MKQFILILVLIILALQVISMKSVTQKSEDYDSEPSVCDRYLTAACEFRNEYPMSNCSTQCYQGTYQFDPLRLDGLSGNLSLCQAVCNTNVNCANFCDGKMNCKCPTLAPGSTTAPVCDPSCPLEDINYLDMDERSQYCAWLKANNYSDTQCGDSTSSCRHC